LALAGILIFIVWEVEMKFLDILANIRAALVKGAGAQLSFGDATQVNDLTVIPVAKISMSIGGGGGSSTPRAKKSAKTDSGEEKPADDVKEKSEGGGGGGNVSTTPLGIYTIDKDNKVSFHPLLGVRELILISGAISLMMYRLIRSLRIKKGR